MKHGNKINQAINLYSFAFLIASILLLVSLVSSLKSVNADGLFQEQLSASFADRKADLIIKMMPPVVATETLQNQSQKPGEPDPILQAFTGTERNPVVATGPIFAEGYITL